MYFMLVCFWPALVLIKCTHWSDALTTGQWLEYLDYILGRNYHALTGWAQIRVSKLIGHQGKASRETNNCHLDPATRGRNLNCRAGIPEPYGLWNGGWELWVYGESWSQLEIVSYENIFWNSNNINCKMRLINSSTWNNNCIKIVNCPRKTRQKNTTAKNGDIFVQSCG